LRGRGREFLRRELIRPGRRPFDHRGQATAMLQDRAVMLGPDLVRREPGQMNHAPEAIASGDKVMPRDGRG